MRRGPRLTEKLLVAADDIPDNSAVLSWYPFGHGNTLEQIITAHNLRTEGELKGALPGPFADCLWEVAPAMVISTGKVAEFLLSPSGSRGPIKVVIFPLDGLDEPTDLLQPLLNLLLCQSQIVHFIQISQRSAYDSLRPRLDSTANLLSPDPEIFNKQADLEMFLHGLRESLVNVWQGIAQNPFDVRCPDSVFKDPHIYPRYGQFMKPSSRSEQLTARVCWEYNRVLARMAAEARDVAMARRLSHEGTINLGRTAAVQEFLLALIREQVRERPNYPVSVDGLRQSLFDLPVNEPFRLRDLQPATVVMVRLTGARSKPDIARSQALADLGFDSGAMAVLHFDLPHITARLEELKELVSVESLTVELPAWNSQKLAGQFGMSERSLGLRVEESFFRDQDREYDKPGNLVV